MDEQDKEIKEQSLRAAFFDIFNGCSKVVIKPSKASTFFPEGTKTVIAYAKHFCFFDQINLDRIREDAFNKAKTKGLPTKEENLSNLNEQGLWTDKDESNWVSKKSYLETLKKTKAKLVVPSQAEGVQKQIDEVTQEVFEQEAKRTDLIGQTCESYANSILNAQTILGSLYADREMTELLIPKEDVDYVDNVDLGLLIACYNDSVKEITIDKVKKMSVSGFFTSYYALVEKTPLSLFNVKNACELTFYQLNLLSYAKVLRSIIRNTDPPKHLIDDPDALLEWSEKGEKQRKVMEKAQSTDKSFSMVGATKEDYEALGANRKGESIFNKKSESGKTGELGIMDFV